jgi:hypothetical protein
MTSLIIWVQICGIMPLHLKAHLERFFDSNNQTSSKTVLHRTRKVEKVTERLRIVTKNTSASDVNHQCSSGPQVPHDYTKDSRRQERAFRETPWTFSKSMCMGPDADVEPSFSAHLRPTITLRTSPMFLTPNTTPPKSQVFRNGSRHDSILPLGNNTWQSKKQSGHPTHHLVMMGSHTIT